MALCDECRKEADTTWEALGDSERYSDDECQRCGKKL